MIQIDLIFLEYFHRIIFILGLYITRTYNLIPKIYELDTLLLSKFKCENICYFRFESQMHKKILAEEISA